MFCCHDGSQSLAVVKLAEIYSTLDSPAVVESSCIEVSNLIGQVVGSTFHRDQSWVSTGRVHPLKAIFSEGNVRVHHLKGFSYWQ